MSGDPIASATLARLYLSQGHGGRARGILEQVLTRDPFDGDALVMARRLGPVPGRVGARVNDGDLVVAWQGIAIREGTSVVAVTARPDGPGRVRVAVTSLPCREGFGQVRFARPPGAGALAACVGRVEPGRGFVALAVAAPLAWPAS